MPSKIEVYSKRQELSHCLQRSEALIQVLRDAIATSGNDHHLIMLEVIEEYMLRAREVIENE